MKATTSVADSVLGPDSAKLWSSQLAINKKQNTTVKGLIG